MCWLSKLFGVSGTERPSPSDIVPLDSITVITKPVGVLVNLAKLNVSLNKPPKIWIPPIPDTNSMDGAFDIGNNNILIAGANEIDQQRLVNFMQVGDIAVYRIPPDFSQTAKIYAIHRIVEIGKDSEGKYFRFKGDNNTVKDPYKVRDSEILWLSIGTIY